MKNNHETVLEYGGIRFCRSRGTPITEREIHLYHEILLYIDGEAELYSRDHRTALSPCSLLVIPKETYHFLKFENSDGFDRLKISFESGSELEKPCAKLLTRLRIYDKLPDELSRLTERMCRGLREDRIDDITAFSVWSSFMMLASELCGLAETDSGEAESDAENDAHRSLIARVMRYIDENLSSGSGIDDIAAAMNVSVSTLTHCFKAELGISPHKYITERRLVYAQKLLSEGRKPSKIYAECGYGDYSSFYKAYLKTFGCSPRGN